MDYFTDMQLQAWGWSVDFLRREIAAGRLHATMQGAGFAIRRDDWDAWVQRYNPAKTHGTAAEAAPGARSNQAFAPVAAAGDPVSEWHNAVDLLVSRGTPRAVAIRMIDQTRPGLRERMIQQHNQRLTQADVAEQAERATARDRARRRPAFQTTI